MAMEKGPLKRLGVFLFLILVVGFILGVSAEAPALADQTVTSQVYSTATDGTGDTAQPSQIVLSWTSDPQTTQTVAWRVYGITDGKVQYMTESESTADFSGAMEKDAVYSDLYNGFNHFEVQLDNLQPDTTYVYRVGTGDCWSEPATFTTAAATDCFSFMFMGDVQMGYDTWGQLLHEAYTNYPDLKFALQCGDLVDTADDPGEWSDLFSAVTGIFDRIPLMPALGNHENEDPSLYIASFALPQNGPSGLEEHNYSFDYGNAHFVVLDSNRMGDEGADYEAGISWLENDLQNSYKKWKLVMFHHPPYGVNSGNSGDDQLSSMMKEKWVPVMERNGVDMVFVGHQHMYMRTYPIYEDQIQEKPTEGITYVMGNAGSKYYTNPEDHDYVAKVIAGEDSCDGYTVINIDGDVMTMTTRNANGDILDDFQINKGSDMDSRVAVNSVKLLDSSYQEISSVPTNGYCRLQVHLNNYTSNQQAALAVIQVRGGDGAAADCGGKSLGIVSLQANIPPAGADVYADFTLPDLPAGKVYVDVYVLDESNVPIDMPYQNFSFDIT